MIKRTIIISVLASLLMTAVSGQVKKQETGLKREITLYNPYKPTLPVSVKMNFLPDMKDTVTAVPVFRYQVMSEPFLPEYSFTPLKAAALLPDPLPKLYKSYINIGLGNYLTPLAEISISNERSKKGTIGFYGRHFSSSGKVELPNIKRVFAGFMDNDASLYGRRFFKTSIFEGSVDVAQKIRYAYGYDPAITDYDPANKDIRLKYNNIGAKASLSSMTSDSSAFTYDFDLSYNYFFTDKNQNQNYQYYQHSGGIKGTLAKTFMGFYVGSRVSFEFYSYPKPVFSGPEYIASINPFVKKSTGLWDFNIGFKALLDRSMNSESVVHFYPDLSLGFSVVPSYVGFFAGLSGKFEKNDPMKVISENPYLLPGLLPGGNLFFLPNTNHELIVSAGLKGNTGLGGNYLLSASYSLINDMLFYSNIETTIVSSPGMPAPSRGNYFAALADDVELLNLHYEMNGPLSAKMSFNAEANYYKYTLSDFLYPWGKPDWNAKLGLKYNLKDKIIAGMELSAEGKRRFIVNGDLSIPVPLGTIPTIIEVPDHYNLNLSAEYRYSKILSVWAKVNNISYNRYYEWAYYPSHRFLCMVGFTYSL